MEQIEKILPKLLKIQLFLDFKINNEDDRRILTEVYKNLKQKNFKKGDVIIKEGDDGDEFFILYSGTVQVLRKTPAGDIIALANLDSDQNIFFGEAALIGTDKRTATVKAITDCSTIVLSGKKFNELCEKEPVFGYRVLLCLAKRMSKTIQDTNSDKATLYEALFNEIEFGS